MFSKALFKQSCKANGIMWAIVTFAVCFTLACVMLITGGGNIGELKNGISDTIITSSVDAEMEKRSINYYTITSNGLEVFDQTFLTTYSQSLAAGATNEQAAAQAYQQSILSLNNYLDTLIEAKGYASDSIEAQEIKGAMFYVININPQDMTNNYDQFYISCGESVPHYDMKDVASASRAQYRKEYATKNTSIFFAGNMVKSENIDQIVEKLESFNITKDDFANFKYTDENGEEVSKFVGTSGYKYIKDLSNKTLVTFAARLDLELEKGVSKDQAIKNVAGDISSSILSNMPQDVSKALTELGEMDLYSLITGSIFYKMAGLLLPIIYIIMVSNNLIAGQVDSGSMAYILSTSTKRKQVIFTQALFLVGSLFAMFAFSTCTSLICLKIVKTSKILLDYTDLLLLNLGAFLTLFAMSGISFLASCIFNRTKYSMSIGGGLNMFFLVATMLGLFGSKVLPSVIRLKSLDYFNFVSIISLFDVVSILDGTTTFIWKFAILVAVGIGCYIAGGTVFKKKDLPL